MERGKLHNMKTPGFKVPEGYFKSLPEKLQDKIQLQALEDLPKHPGFQAPDDYFDAVETTILNRVSKESNSKVIRFNTKKVFTYISGIAAALLLFFALFPENTSDNSVTVEMVEAQLAYSDLDSYELAELLMETEFLEIEDLSIEPSYDDEALEDYLLENADLEQIILQ